jgi:hypothetical protein
VLICLFPDHFAYFAWIFGGLCWVTTATRVAAAITAFRAPRVGSAAGSLASADETEIARKVVDGGL